MKVYVSHPPVDPAVARAMRVARLTVAQSRKEHANRIRNRAWHVKFEVVVRPVSHVWAPPRYVGGWGPDNTRAVTSAIQAAEASTIAELSNLTMRLACEGRLKMKGGSTPKKRRRS